MQGTFSLKPGGYCITVRNPVYYVSLPTVNLIHNDYLIYD